MRPSGSRRCALPLVVALLISACQPPQQQIIYTGEPLIVAPEPEPEPDPREFDAFQRQRILADMLYEARMAYENNQLMTPPGINAYERYHEVLGIDPGNTIARQGIVDIASRYAQLADVAIAQAQYDNAASLLRRGEQVMPGLEALAATRARLDVARQTKVDTYELDPAGLRNQSPDTMSRLAEIAQRIRDQDAAFLINARNDAEGRWIYKVMREAVDGYRLRGNIAIAGSPMIVVTPRPESG